MGVKEGYKRTEIGVIPEGWEVRELSSVTDVRDGTHESPKYQSSGVKFVTSKNIVNGKLDLSDIAFISGDDAEHINKRSKVDIDDILMAMIGTIGNAVLIDKAPDFCIKNVALIKPYKDKVCPKYLYQLIASSGYQNFIHSKLAGGIQKFISLSMLRSLCAVIPPLPEQRTIATALSDIDGLIDSLSKLIEKKKNIKQGAMQELLTGKKRIEGFSGEWEVRTIEELCECLDHLRIPLNESTRKKMQGQYPYCGANGILDYINDYMIDDDIILIAEDGGYFEEYATRHIAYKMSGKCWINNHAHILKAKNGTYQDYIFYSLVHKNILPYLSSGTRSKLNKSEMYKIEIMIPVNIDEQTAIATILSNMDSEIEKLQSKLDKYKAIKQGMMQELLTGRIRLLEGA